VADPASIDDGTGPNIGGAASGYSSTPVPDPTILTTQALYREVAAIDAKFTQRIDAVLVLLNEKQARTNQQIEMQVTARNDALSAIKDDWRHEHVALTATLEDAIKGATDLRGAEVSLVANEIAHLADTVDEKFRSIATQFLERDTRSERESRDNKVAVDAAFAAQKEAAAKQEETFSKGIDKSEAATQETINKLTELFRTTNQGLSDKVDDLKQRMSDIEKSLQQRITEVAGVANASVAEKRGGSASVVLGLAVLGAIGTVTAIVAVIVAVTRAGG
jgi:hypothetical protein